MEICLGAFLTVHFNAPPANHRGCIKICLSTMIFGCFGTISAGKKREIIVNDQNFY